MPESYIVLWICIVRKYEGFCCCEHVFYLFVDIMLLFWFFGISCSFMELCVFWVTDGNRKLFLHLFGCFVIQSAYENPQYRFIEC